MVVGRVFASFYAMQEAYCMEVNVEAHPFNLEIVDTPMSRFLAKNGIPEPLNRRKECLHRSFEFDTKFTALSTEFGKKKMVEFVLACRSGDMQTVQHHLNASQYSPGKCNLGMWTSYHWRSDAILKYLYELYLQVEEPTKEQHKDRIYGGGECGFLRSAMMDDRLEIVKMFWERMPEDEHWAYLGVSAGDVSDGMYGVRPIRVFEFIAAKNILPASYVLKQTCQPFNEDNPEDNRIALYLTRKLLRTGSEIDFNPSFVRQDSVRNLLEATLALQNGVLTTNVDQVKAALRNGASPFSMHRDAFNNYCRNAFQLAARHPTDNASGRVEIVKLILTSIAPNLFRFFSMVRMVPPLQRFLYGSLLDMQVDMKLSRFQNLPIEVGRKISLKVFNDLVYDRCCEECDNLQDICTPYPFIIGTVITSEMQHFFEASAIMGQVQYLFHCFYK